MEIILVFVFGLINLFLGIFSFFKMRQDKEKLHFMYWWGFVVGAFVWEDMFIFGFLHFGFSLLAVILNSPRIWLICFLIFWIIRSLGETLYFFLEQFIIPQHHPHYIHDHLGPMKKIFGNISDQKCFILLQILMQSVTVVCLIALIYLLRH